MITYLTLCLVIWVILILCFIKSEDLTFKDLGIITFLSFIPFVNLYLSIVFVGDALKLKSDTILIKKRKKSNE